MNDIDGVRVRSYIRLAYLESCGRLGGKHYMAVFE